MESFVWVLAYITVANIEHKDRTVKISPLPEVDTWFKYDSQVDRKVHIWSKQRLHSEYGLRQQDFQGYYRYHSVVQQMAWYWDVLHKPLLALKYTHRPLQPGAWKPVQEEELVPGKPEVDDPTGSLRQFITMMEKLFGERGIGEGFFEVKTLLLEAIEPPAAKLEV